MYEYHRQLSTLFFPNVVDQLVKVAAKEKAAIVESPQPIVVEGWLDAVNKENKYEDAFAVENGFTQRLTTYRNVSEPEVVDTLGKRPEGTDPVVETTTYFVAPDGRLAVRVSFVENGDFRPDPWNISRRHISRGIPMRQQYYVVPTQEVTGMQAVITPIPDSTKKRLTITKVK